MSPLGEETKGNAGATLNVYRGDKDGGDFTTIPG